MRMGNLLVRGMLVGLAAAVLSLVFAYLFGEPQVDSAIGFEGTHSHGAEEEPELVSRGIQSTLGLAVAVGAYGLAFGGLFALGFAFAYGRLGRLGARATSGVLAIGAFVVVFLVPYLKYPANPPAVGQSETIGSRTAWYFTMVLISLVVGIVCTVLARRWQARVGTWNAVLLGVAAYVVVVSVAAAVLPIVNEIPEHFPADVLWSFRVASLGTQLVLWAGIGVLFGLFTDRHARRVAEQTPAVTV
jgi:predicted cobalt transporter CbtA